MNDYSRDQKKEHLIQQEKPKQGGSQQGYPQKGQPKSPKDPGGNAPKTPVPDYRDNPEQVPTIEAEENKNGNAK